MKPHLDVDEIIQHFTLLPEEIDFLGRNDSHNHLGKALVLKFFQSEGRFPEGCDEFTPAIIEYVAQQLNLPPEVIKQYNFDGRTISVHRGQIRELLGFQKATLADEDALRDWMVGEVIPHEYRPVYLEQLCYQRLRQVQIEAPTKGQMGRVIKSALHRYEQSFFADTAAHLSSSVKENLRQLIYKKEELQADIDLQDSVGDDFGYYPIHDLKSGAGDAKIGNIKKVAKRLELLQSIGLPDDLFTGIPLRFLRQYQQQVAVESISHLQRRGQGTQAYARLAIFCWVRQREITDQLVDLFIRILKDISLRAEHLVEREILRDFIGVRGKQQLLYRLAEAMWDHPDGIIREVLYPVVGPEKLQLLVQEAKTKGTYQQSVQTRINASYTYHYRRMLPALLEVLTFRSNNERYKPLIEALALVADYLGDKSTFYPEDQSVPMDGVIAKRWQNWIYSNDKFGRRRIRRARYELCVLQSLRDKLRCKEIWVQGADRYRNPDEDVPPDFSAKRSQYYESLLLPLNADHFVKQVKGQVEQSLQTLNDTLPTNKDVEILSKSDGWIRLSRMPKQQEPTNLRYLKNEIRQRWWMTSLLDIIKEVDFRVGFTDSFQSLTGQQRLAQPELQKRLLLCLFGLGTNTGLTSVSMGNHGVSQHKRCRCSGGCYTLYALTPILLSLCQYTDDSTDVSRTGLATANDRSGLAGNDSLILWPCESIWCARKRTEREFPARESCLESTAWLEGQVPGPEADGHLKLPRQCG